MRRLGLNKLLLLMVLLGLILMSSNASKIIKTVSEYTWITAVDPKWIGRVPNLEKNIFNKINKYSNPPIKNKDLSRFPGTLIDITLPKKSESKLHVFTPVTGYEYVDAKVTIDNGQSIKAKVRYRGDRLVHILQENKSWKVKFRKDDLLNGYRKYNLILPKNHALINNHLSYVMARSIGIHAPISQMAFVTLNGKPNGVRLMVPDIDESFLRHENMMPADIYAGEAISFDEEFKGDFAHKNIFRDTMHWSKKSCNNHYQCSSKKPLKRLMEADVEELENLVDLEYFAKFTILTELFSTTHLDFSHNHRIYYDPYKEKFYPIFWDPIPFVQHELPEFYKEKGLPLSGLISVRLHGSDKFLDAKYRVASKFFNEDIDKLQKVLAEEVENANSINTWLGSVNYGDPDKNSKALVELQEIYYKARNALSNVYGFKNDSCEFKYSVHQNSVLIRAPYNCPYSKFKLSSNGEKSGIDETCSYDIHSGKNLIDLRVFRPAWSVSRLGPSYRNQSFVAKPMKEDFIAKLRCEKPIPSNHELHILAFNGKQYRAVYADDTSDWPNPNLVMNEVEDVNTTILSGEIIFNSTEVFYNPVVITQGSELILAPGVSLIFRSKLDALGSKENPIIIRRKIDNSPWGSIVLHKGSDNSKLAFLKISGGSGFKGDMFEYIGMLSIHWSENIAIENVEFSDSSITDDMVHVMYADVAFDSCIFNDSHSDAIDADMSTISVTNSIFMYSGNDALDLMSSSAVVTNSEFNSSGDKGISVGEDSRLSVTNSKFFGNEIGVQSKDNSIANINGSNFIDNKIDLSAYRKNWRYGNGGEFIIKNSVLSPRKISIDENSKLLSFD